MFDILAFLTFLLSWCGYIYFARSKAKTSDCIARCLHQHRIHWMYEVMTRDVRVGESSILGNLERSIAFFASSTLLVLAGVLTLFSQVDKFEAVITTIPFAEMPNYYMIQVKLALLATIFILAFFQFTWSMRQYGFVNVMIGAAPIDLEGLDENLKKYALQVAKVQDQAAHSYNNGLRSYYFSIAAMCWFIHPLAFALASAIVVSVLYKREFTSKTVKAITAGKKYLDIHRAKKFPRKHPFMDKPIEKNTK